MKTTSQVTDRVRFLLVGELNRRVEEAQKRLPHRCAHNHRQLLDIRKRVEGVANAKYNQIINPDQTTIGLCMLGADNVEEWKGNICEDPIDAQRCPYFLPERGKLALWAEFQKQVEDVEWLRTKMPEVYGLLWALEAPHPGLIPWWKKLWFRLFQLQIEPLVHVEPLTNLLEAPKKESGGPVSP